MKVKVRANIPTAAIMAKRGLGRSKRARRFIASEVKRLADPYVPMQTGALKNGAQIGSDGSTLIYPGPYAHYLYEGIVYGPNIPTADGGFFSRAPKHPTGRALHYHGAPMRGSKWIDRMMAACSRDLQRSVAIYVGGKTK